MDLRVVRCAFVLLTCAGACFGQELLLPERINGTVGEKVVITPMRIPDPPHQYIRWNFNTNTILSGPPGGITIQPQYADRVNLDTSTLALDLRSLTDSDTGQYTLSVETTSGKVFTNETSLHVLMAASNVIIVPSNTELVEFNSTVSLVCSASGSFLSFIWLNGSSEVTAGERVQLTNSNSKLTITSVIRGDTGPYQCEASNSFSNAKSSPLNLNISYGPENVTVVAAPVGPSYSSGSNLILTCSADSSPAAEFQWAVNGAELGKMGQELKLSNIQSSDSGNYTCMAHNKQTLRYATSESINVTVLVQASNVLIIASNTELFEFNSTVSLGCSASGSSLSFTWLNGSSEVTAGERVQLTNSNSNLTITSVIRGDTGPYQCKASNIVSNAKSPPLSLNIYYGPENVTVVAAPVGPSYSSGSNLILTCTADSSPAAEFQWAVNGAELSEMGQELKLSNIQSSDSGNYTCMAHNKQSLRYATSEPISITVLGIGTNGEGSLSAGAIAGIVIGVLLGVAAIAGLIFYFVKDKKIPKITSGGNKQDEATPNERQLEMHYAEINHLQSNQGQQRVPAMPRAQTSQHNKTAASNPAAQTVYADVRNI